MNNKRNQIFAWCLYDWANSAFVLTAVTAFFPFLFKSYYSGAHVGMAETTLRLGAGHTVAGLTIAVLSLALGAVADFWVGKKRFLGFFVAVGALATASLFFVASGSWLLALILFIIGNIGFSCSNLFYDSLLLDVAEEKNMDFISSMGFAFGYAGGVLLFGFCLWMTASPQLFGMSDTASAIRLSFICVAVWWALFSIPLLILVKEKRQAAPPAAKFLACVVRAIYSIGAVWRTLKAIVKNPALILFLCAYWLYFDGVNTFIRMSVDFGTSIGFDFSALMTALIVVQLVAFPSSLLFGFLASKVGAGRMIMAGVVIYIFITSFGALFMRTEAHFITLAYYIGLAQGGIQALSRSYFGKLIPANESNEYFAFYNVVSRFAVIGPIVIGLVAMAVRSMGAEETMASRIGMSSINLFFISGLILLMFAERARKRALVGKVNG